jgi:predicted flap endonuclease-1-like 5' DNA nuclease
MGYVFVEILIFLLVAVGVGFLFGWFARGCLEPEPQTHNISEIEVKPELKEVKPIEEVKTTSEVEAQESVKEAEVNATSVEATKEEKQEEQVKEPENKVSEVIETKVEEETSKEDASPVLLTEARKEGKDKLSTIRGIGPVIEKTLNDLGVYHFDQIASWSEEEQLWIGTQIAFPKRVMREEWVKQAQELVQNRE